MKARVYLETTFISYLAAPPSTDAMTAARQLSSRLWWERERGKYELVISQLVERECARGDAEQASRRREFLGEVFLVVLERGILELASKLTGPGLIPESAEADAVHVAAAAVSGCRYLMTWNFRHIANAMIRHRLERVFGAEWLQRHHNLYRRRTLGIGNRGRMKSYGRSMRFAKKYRPSMDTT